MNLSDNQDAASNHDAARAVGQWFKAAFAGCAFASKLAIEKQLAMLLAGLDDEIDPENLNVFLDRSAARKQVSLIVFPRIRTPEEVGVLLGKMGAASPRWKVSQPEWGTHKQPDVVPIALEFQTGSMKWSAAMGLGPIGTMPATRRAPFVAIAVWAGDVENSYRPPPRAHWRLDWFRKWGPWGNLTGEVQEHVREVGAAY